MRRHEPVRTDDGLTLIELLITVVLLGIIVAPLGAAFVVAFRNVGSTVAEFTDSNSLLKASTFFVTDTQDADEVHTERISQTQADLHGVRFATGTTGWVVGDRGTVMLTTDQGETFTIEPVPTTVNLFGVGVVANNENLAWLLGAGGTILKTADGGTTWTQQTTPVTTPLRRGHFKDANNGIVVGDGGTILKTTNGGTTWTQQTSTTNAHIHAIAFRDGNNGVAVGAGGITLFTSNYGGTWAAQTNRPPMTSTLRGIHVRDDSNGWVVGDQDAATGFSMVVCTKDCTKINPTWIGVTNPGTTQDLSVVAGISSTNIWAGGVGGVIVGCKNSCTAANSVWTPEDTSIAEDVTGLHAVDPTHVWATARGGTTLTYVLNRWARQNPPPGFTSRLNAVSFRDSSKGIAVGNGGSAIVTSNAGTTWVTQSTGTSEHLNDVWHQSGSSAIAVGQTGTVRYCDANCENANANWIIQIPLTATGTPLGENLHGVWWKDTSTAWLVGANGTMRICTSNCHRTTATWAIQTPLVPLLGVSVNAVQGVAAGEAYAVAAGGRVLVCSSNCDKATAIWLQPSTPTSQDLKSIRCTSNSKCYAVGSGGTILVCNSSCRSGSSVWELKDSQTETDLTFVRTVSATVAYASGLGGTVLATDDGGETWIPETTTVSNNLHGITAPTAANQWAVGGAATIITTVSGGTPQWIPQTEDTLLEEPARVCDGADPLLISFWAAAADGGETSTTYVVRDDGGGKSFVRQVCSRPADAEEDEPLVLLSEVAVSALAPSGDPVLTCTTSSGTSVPCSDATRISLSVTGTAGRPFVLTGARR